MSSLIEVETLAAKRFAEPTAALVIDDAVLCQKNDGECFA